MGGAEDVWGGATRAARFHYRKGRDVNRALCNSCKSWVPADRVTRDGKVYLKKTCPKCGVTEALVSSDAARHNLKRDLDPGFDHRDCGAVQCTECSYHRRPTYAFVDVTNRCNLNCPMCADSVASHNFAFDPPLEHFRKIFEHLHQFDPLPTVALFGGEPTVREDLIEIIKLARSYGLDVRVLTNGLKLADEEYCRKLVAARPHLLVSYDGCKPATYAQLRRSPKVLDQKRKAVENLGKCRRARVSYVTCLAWGLNHKEVPDILEFCHRQRDILHGIYLMPLVQVWESDEFSYTPDRMTTEDVERFVAECFPDYNVQFISLGVASHFTKVAQYLGRGALPYPGTHPNCESFYLLISDSQKYLPVDYYLKKPFPEVAREFVKLEERLVAREKRWETSAIGRFLRVVHLRTFFLKFIGRLNILGAVRRSVRFSRFFKGKGLGKAYHAFMGTVELLFRRKSRAVRERHMTAQDVLRIIVLPLEDDPIVETDRLGRCPSVHVYYDPRTGDFKYVPVCSWRFFNKRILGELAACYSAKAPAEKAEAAVL